jgi:hypothetical protein
MTRWNRFLRSLRSPYTWLYLAVIAVIALVLRQCN